MLFFTYHMDEEYEFTPAQQNGREASEEGAATTARSMANGALALGLFCVLVVLAAGAYVVFTSLQTNTGI